MMKRVFYSAVFFLIGFSQLSADPKPTEILAQYNAIYWGDDLERTATGDWKTPELYIYSQARFQLLVPNVNQMGPMATYQGPRKLPLYVRVMEPDGEWNYQPIAQVNLPETRAFVLFIAPRDGDGYSASAIDVSDHAIPEGSLAFLNLTHKEIAADIRGDVQRMQARKLALFRPQLSAEPDLPLRIAVFDKEWKSAYSTVTRLAADRSYLMVFYLQGNREGAYRLRIFRNVQQLREGLNSQ